MHSSKYARTLVDLIPFRAGTELVTGTTLTDYFDSQEQEVSSLADLALRFSQVQALARSSGLKFYWRGQANADWGVHSSIHRAIAAQRALAVETIADDDVSNMEVRLVDEARGWIRPSVGARLTTIDLLARLQHFGIPTRLIDFTSLPQVAMLFAVAEHPTVDGRLIIAAARGVPSEEFRNSFSIPWIRDGVDRPVDWPRQLFALDDQQDFLRITRQGGAFLVGGTPSTQPQRRVRGENMHAVDVRKSMSIPLVLHSWAQAEAAESGQPARGRAATVASALTLRIPTKAKNRLRTELDSLGINWAALFPDPDGLKAYGELTSSLVDALGQF